MSRGRPAVPGQFGQSLSILPSFFFSPKSKVSIAIPGRGLRLGETSEDDDGHDGDEDDDDYNNNSNNS